MEITIYGTPTCNQCKMLCKKLDEKNIQYFYIQDEETVMRISEKLNIVSVPIIEVDGKVVDIKEFAKKLGMK